MPILDFRRYRNRTKSFTAEIASSDESASFQRRVTWFCSNWRHWLEPSIWLILLTCALLILAQSGRRFPDSWEPARWLHWFVRFARENDSAFFVFVILIGVLNQLLVPINLLLLAAALAFPGWSGFACGLLGGLFAAFLEGSVGRLIGEGTLRKKFGARFDAVAEEVAASGFTTLLLLTIVPVAPSVVTNMVAGVCRVPRWKHLAATAIGFLPGLAILNLLSHNARRFWGDPSLGTAFWILGLLVIFVFLGQMVRRILRRPKRV